MNVSEGDACWYMRSPLGKNLWSAMLKTLSKEAKLSRTYTNHCLRASSITRLKQAGFDDRKIATVSGHKSLDSLGTFCKPKFGNFDGNGPRPGERCETKWRIFAKIHPNVRLEGPGTEQNFRFGSAWPVRVCPCGHVLRQFGIAGRRINFRSFCLFFSYAIIFEIVELYSVNFVFSSCSMFSSPEVQAITKPSISPSEGVVTREKA